MPNNAPNSTDSFPPELEMALVSLEKGRQDLKAVDKWQADKDVSVEIIGFHIQQAIEKSLKAILLSCRIDFPRTHNLGLLIELCQNNGISTAAEFLQVDVFNRFAVEWRYDLSPSMSDTSLDRKEAYNTAHTIWIWAKRLVNSTS